ncbi:hypothetical protein [Aliarcobacter skirrowii]|uniref:Uncharacterized protein n=1 Tax=Aliarcobacter skirrowii CCUG 10374 TaxID=1032239 RepID=A0AAD0SQM2_9BACT|nr:hypothetical protein [Aliarcobacter skirrowii]AXX84615.1 hypothetical protein ASKIR_0794 [Aliarcobacter skirrowii CCUG 10374]KAB0619009.1 hypothetical protein F7P70_10010 [Aliarcobacter skirrowii CCUG 10374]SUV14782.1 Uncharacterised protein [Aliarcobacter skirrowii]
MQKFNLDDIVDFYIKTINVPENTTVNIGLTPLDINKNSFDNKMVNDTTTVKKYKNENFAKYPFIPRDIIKELKINEKNVFYIKGWIDANNDKKICIDKEEVILEIVKDVFIGLMHNPSNNKVHLLTKKDIEKYKLNNINPVTQALEGKHPILAGSGSIYAGLYGFGDWASRLSGFRDWQLDNENNEEKNKASLETKYILKLIKYIISDENGSRKIFFNSVEKYIKENPTYVTSRLLTGIGMGIIVQPKNNKVPVGLISISSPAILGDITFTAKEIDDFAKGIVLGN